MVLGKHLPAFSKSILRNGQAYYLVTIIISLCFVLFYYYRVPDSFIASCTLGLPTFVLINTMTCHVYRNVRIGVYQDEVVRTTAIRRHLEQIGQGDTRIGLGG